MAHKVPAAARDRRQQALAIRREAEDARGAAQSLHGIGKAYCGLDRPDDAEQALDEAAQAADMLGEHLLGAKITHALAETTIAGCGVHIADVIGHGCACRQGR